MRTSTMDFPANHVWLRVHMFLAPRSRQVNQQLCCAKHLPVVALFSETYIQLHGDGRSWAWWDMEWYGYGKGVRIFDPYFIYFNMLSRFCTSPGNVDCIFFLAVFCASKLQWHGAVSLRPESSGSVSSAANSFGQRSHQNLWSQRDKGAPWWKIPSTLRRFGLYPIYPYVYIYILDIYIYISICILDIPNVFFCNAQFGKSCFWLKNLDAQLQVQLLNITSQVQLCTEQKFYTDYLFWFDFRLVQTWIAPPLRCARMI